MIFHSYHVKQVKKHVHMKNTMSTFSRKTVCTTHSMMNDISLILSENRWKTCSRKKCSQKMWHRRCNFSLLVSPVHFSPVCLLFTFHPVCTFLVFVSPAHISTCTTFHVSVSIHAFLWWKPLFTRTHFSYVRLSCAVFLCVPLFTCMCQLMRFSMKPA